MNKTLRKIGTAIMGLALVAGLSTSCSNGDCEYSLEVISGYCCNMWKVSVYFAMQAPIRVITLCNDEDEVISDDYVHQFNLQATWCGGWKDCKDCGVGYQIEPPLLREGSGVEVRPGA